MAQSEAGTPFPNLALEGADFRKAEWKGKFTPVTEPDGVRALVKK